MAGQLSFELTDLQVLKGALEILQDEQKWTKGKFARDEDGESCSPISPEACKFCLMGAMRKAANNDSGLVIRAMKKFETVNEIPLITQWNDEHVRKHSEVLAALKKTIWSIENV